LPPGAARDTLAPEPAACSFGQLPFAPFGVAMIDNLGWQTH